MSAKGPVRVKIDAWDVSILGVEMDGDFRIKVRGENSNGREVQVLIHSCCEHAIRSLLEDFRQSLIELKQMRDRNNRANLEVFSRGDSGA